MRNKVLIDTSVWVEFFRGKNQKLKKAVCKLIEGDRACLAGVVLAELLHGVKKENELRLLEETLPAIEYLEVTREIWEKTGEALRELRMKGVTLPLTDVLVATLAAENDYEILTTDAHFKKLKNVIFYKT